MGTPSGGNRQLRVPTGTIVKLRYTCQPGTSLSLAIRAGSEGAEVVNSFQSGNEWGFDVKITATTPGTDIRFDVVETTGPNTAQFILAFSSAPPASGGSSPGKPPDAAPPESEKNRTGDCSRLGEVGTIYQFPVEVRAPGENDFKPVSAEAFCATGTLRADGMVALHIYPGPETGYEWYPEGTTYRFTGLVPDFRPGLGIADLEGFRFSTEANPTAGSKFTVEGRPLKRQYSLDAIRNCTGPFEPVYQGFGAGVERWDRTGANSNMAGLTMASNGTGASVPLATGTGIAWEADGCGDDDPNTKEGFYEVFMPPALLESFGVTQEKLARSSSIGDAFAVEDNGYPANDLTFTKEPFNGKSGVRLYYRLSFTSANNGTTRAKGAQSGQAPRNHRVTVSRWGSTEPTVKWAVARKKRIVTATVPVASAGKTTYSITAARRGVKTRKVGKCGLEKAASSVNCSLRLPRGRWTVSVVPKLGKSAGKAASKAVKF